MRQHHWGILFVTLLVVGGLMGYTLVKNGLFPIAWVNGRFIAFKTVQENARVAQRLYTNIDELPTGDPLHELFVESGGTVFERAFESAIVHKIIESRAEKSVRQEAESRTQDYLDRTDIVSLQASIDLAYGWDMDRFRDRILEPSILQEVLIEKRGDEFDTWFNDAVNSSHVAVWFVPFEWHDGELHEK